MTKLIVSKTDKIEQTQLYECAAWYTVLKIMPGQYELVKATDRYGKVNYVAKVDAEVVSDFFPALFGGVSISKSPYDTKKNAGNPAQRSMSFTPSQLLTHKSIEIAPEDYDTVLDEALAQLAYNIEISMACLNDATPEWMSGHAESLTKDSKLYSELYHTKARRGYNEKNGEPRGGGDKAWDYKNSHAIQTEIFDQIGA